MCRFGGLGRKLQCQWSWEWKMESKLVTTSASQVNRRVWNPTCSAMLSFITIFAIWSSSCASEVMVVVAVATFSTLRLHMRRSSSQSAMPSLLHGASRKPAGGAGGWTPNSSLTGHEGSGYLSITGKHFTCSVRLLLPKLSEKDSHHFGHVDVNVNRKFSIRVVEIINIIDLGYKWIYHSEPNKYIHCKLSDSDYSAILSHHNSTPSRRVKRIWSHFPFLVVLDVKWWMLSIWHIQQEVEHRVGRSSIRAWNWKLHND